MSKTLLITRPDHDITTHYLSSWGRLIFEAAEKNGFKILDLHGKRASKSEFESFVKEFSPKVILFNGHGNENTIGGHENEPLVTLGKNEKLLASRIIYSISCKSAKNLGRKSIDSGAMSFTGYDDDFIFFYDVKMTSRPVEDETAKLFLGHSKIFVNSLLKGNSISESYNRAKGSMKNNITKLLSSESPDSGMIRFLWWNMKHFVTQGNADIKA